MDLCVVVISDVFYSKLSGIERIFAWLNPKKVFNECRESLSVGYPLSILVVPEIFRIKRIARILKKYDLLRKFDTVLLESRFLDYEKVFKRNKNFLVSDVSIEREAQIILNLALGDKLFKKTAATMLNKKQISVGISITEDWPFSYGLLIGIASIATYVTILSRVGVGSFAKIIEQIEKEYGLECFISQDDTKGLIDCDIVISYGLPEKSRFKRDVIIIDLLNNIKASVKRTVVNGFEAQVNLSEAMALVKKNLGLKIILLYFIYKYSENSDANFSESFKCFCEKLKYKNNLMRHDTFLTQIRNGFEQLGFFVNTICKEVY